MMQLREIFKNTKYQAMYSFIVSRQEEIISYKYIKVTLSPMSLIKEMITGIPNHVSYNFGFQ